VDVELQTIRQFLQASNPFDRLPEESLNKLLPLLEVRYLRRGSKLSADILQVFIIRSGLIQITGPDNQVITQLAEHDVYTPYTSLQPEAVGQVLEDTLLYALDLAHLEAIWEAHPDFAQFFANTPGARLRQASISPTTPAGETTFMQLQAGQLLRRKLVTISGHRSIHDAALIMSHNDISSVVITEKKKLVGLLTDRDLRNRCVAKRLSSKTPVAEVMTRNPATIRSETSATEAMSMMARLRIHHLPVVDDDRLIGMLTATDLANGRCENPAILVTDIVRSKTLNELKKVLSRLPGLQIDLSNANATAAHIGDVIASTTDALTIRLLELAEAQLGAPPAPYVWMAVGSQGRMEQTVHSDQDNALLISDQLKRKDANYFKQLAHFVCDGLNQCGFVYCPGNAMATNPKWCVPLSQWHKYFDRWINHPEPMSLMLSSIFFDMRPVYGSVELFNEMHAPVLKQSCNNRIFLAHLVANAVKLRPPLGFFRHFVLAHNGEHANTLDIKHRGVGPITDIARVLALSEGLAPVNTLDRLNAAANKRALSNEMAKDLRDAYELIASLRIRHQSMRLQAGKQPDNYLYPEHLSGLERGYLKDAFQIVQTMQDALINSFQAATLI